MIFYYFSEREALIALMHDIKYFLHLSRFNSCIFIDYVAIIDGLEGVLLLL